MLLVLALGNLAAPALNAATPSSIIDLGDLSDGIGLAGNGVAGLSGDASVAVGSSCCPVHVGAQGFSRAYRFTVEGGLEQLPLVEGGTRRSSAWAASQDGSIVVGMSSSDAGETASVWDSEGHVLAIGWPYGGLATSVSADGRFVVGRHFSPTMGGYQIFRWTLQGGAVLLPRPPGSNGNDYAWSVSADGSRILGELNLRKPFLWEDGVFTPIGPLERGTHLSDDGLVVLGTAATDVGSRAVLWTKASGVIGLGPLPGDRDNRPEWTYESRPGGMTPDASVVVGWIRGSDGGSGSEQLAFIWDATLGIRPLEEVLQADGLDTSGFDIEYAVDVSDDGNKIVGQGGGSAPQTLDRSWLITLPEPHAAPAALLALYALQRTAVRFRLVRVP